MPKTKNNLCKKQTNNTRNIINIKSTMCHHGLKAVVCDRHSCFGCSRNNSILKDGVSVKFLDIIKILLTYHSNLK